MSLNVLNLENAVILLNDNYKILSSNQNDILTTVLEDAVIKRFEYTLEISNFYDK